MEDFMDKFKKDMVILEISRKRACISRMYDSEMVVNEEENGCRFDVRGKETGYTHDLRLSGKGSWNFILTKLLIHQHALVLEVIQYLS